MKHIRNLLLTGIVLLAITGNFSCKSSPGPCDAVITVVDSLNRPVSGALVVLKQDSVVNPNTGVKASVNQQQATNSSGQASFQFALEAVLNIVATKDSMIGRDYIRLEQGGSVSKTVVIKK